MPEASSDASVRETKARVTAFMGLRIMSEQGAQLAKQGSIIPHPFPERHLSRLPQTPPPLGKSACNLSDVSLQKESV